MFFPPPFEKKTGGKKTRLSLPLPSLLTLSLASPSPTSSSSSQKNEQLRSPRGGPALPPPPRPRKLPNALFSRFFLSRRRRRRRGRRRRGRGEARERARRRAQGAQGEGRRGLLPAGQVKEEKERKRESCVGSFFPAGEVQGEAKKTHKQKKKRVRFSLLSLSPPPSPPPDPSFPICLSFVFLKLVFLGTRIDSCYFWNEQKGGKNDSE